MGDGHWRQRDRVAVREERVEIMRARLEGMVLPDGMVSTCDVTIFPARYGGSYEGAEWLAWIGDPEWLDDYQAGDNACASFWEDYRRAPVGRGSDPNGALADIVRQARKAGTP
jgi:hypothetical protein